MKKEKEKRRINISGVVVLWDGKHVIHMGFRVSFQSSNDGQMEMAGGFFVAWGWGRPDSVSLSLFLSNCSKVSTEFRLV